ncbi:chemotaxis protein CheA [Nitrincola nitratireducens]|uniref:Chemotaxis protein CheA n=1 Tax=Nitrincola nitratireducens TaxID=1229521 RepID=W9V826_9GAMM|nr:chemotaxis protein CheA [Nitrincola nitratireducens]EXJ12237.1 Chemotaxis protein CheA [Nitrincola nitratireducens]
MSSPLHTFKEEAREHLENLENALLVLEDNPYDTEQISLAFRAMHTIKGAGGMVGMDHLSYFTHHLETFFEYVRSGDITLTAEMISLVLESSDHISALLQEMNPSTELKVISESLIKRCEKYTPKKDINDTVTPMPLNDHDLSVGTSTENEVECWAITLIPNQTTFKDGFDLIPLLKELKSLGSCQIKTTLVGFEWTLYDPQLSYLHVDVLLATSAGRNAIDDVFIFVQDDWNIQCQRVDIDESDRLGDLLVDKGLVSSDAIDQLIETQPKIGEVLTQSGLIDPSMVKKTLDEQAFVRGERQLKAPPTEEQTIRIPVGKLDMLMNLVGELVIAQVRLEQIASEVLNDDLTSVAEELSRLSTELRDTAFDIRMLPIGTTFGRFKRLIRDLNRELGKSVRLETYGAETELDKMVLDKLGDPLVHLLRNSMDHGVERPDVRELAGKNTEGVIVLSATHSEGQILITIRDDGAGLNTQKIEAKAIERGLIKPGHGLNEEALHQLIFEPGFSTADSVSDVSGRGVGMDVVRTSIESLRGRIRIQSQLGLGTQISIYLPMTLAIIEGLMVRVSDQRYVIPLTVVEECLETLGSEMTQDDGARLIEKRGELISCVRLREFFSVEGEMPLIEQTVVTRSSHLRLGITVDEVIGQHQTVIKSLGKLYQKTPGLMGATITGNGNVAMILDVNELADEIARNRSELQTGRYHHDA